MRELITDEMVEVAARAEADVSWPTTAWDGLPYDVRAVFVDHARAALDAAAPLIAAEARRKAAEDRRRGEWSTVTDEDASLRDRLQETIALVVAPYTSGPMDPLDVQITDAVMDALAAARAETTAVTDDARAEAMSRYSFGTYHGQMVQWHDAKKLAVDAFTDGAKWAAARAETTTAAAERIARQIAATSAMTGRDALELVEAVQALQNAETTTDLHWSNAAAAEYPDDVKETA